MKLGRILIAVCLIVAVIITFSVLRFYFDSDDSRSSENDFGGIIPDGVPADSVDAVETPDTNINNCLVFNEGLEWLKRHQHLDGYWDADGFTEYCSGDKPCSGNAAVAELDVAVTALSLLAFNYCGYAHDDRSEYAVVVEKALSWLCGLQEDRMDNPDEEGLIAGESESDYYLFGHILATCALTETYCLTGSLLFLEPAQLAVRYLLEIQNDNTNLVGAKYGFGIRPNESQCNTVITGWAARALYMGRFAEFGVPDSVFAGILHWFNDVTDPETQCSGLNRRGDAGTVADSPMAAVFPAAESETCSAIAAYWRITIGPLPDVGRINTLISILEECSPGSESDTIDFHYWFWGTQALHALTLDRTKVWTDWRTRLFEQSLKRFCRDREACERGSWDPRVSADGSGAGRVYSTAINILCLRVADFHYRSRRKPILDESSFPESDVR